MSAPPPDRETATDEELAEYIVAADEGGIHEAVHTLAIQRLMVAKGLVTFEEIEEEKQRAAFVVIGSQMQAYRAVDIWDKDADEKTTSIINEAMNDYVAHGVEEEPVVAEEMRFGDDDGG